METTQAGRKDLCSGNMRSNVESGRSSSFLVSNLNSNNYLKAIDCLDIKQGRRNKFHIFLNRTSYFEIQNKHLTGSLNVTLSALL